MANFYKKLTSKTDKESNKQINIVNYREIDNYSLEDYYNDLNKLGLEVLSDVLKEDSGQVPQDINKPQDVEEGTPPDPRNEDVGGGDADSEEDSDASMEEDTDLENEEDGEDMPKYQLNKNEFATEFGMIKLVSYMNDLVDSINKTIRKLRPNPKVNKTLIELEELANIVEEEKKLIPVVNIYETQAKYYLYIERYAELLKKIGIKVQKKK